MDKPTAAEAHADLMADRLDTALATLGDLGQTILAAVRADLSDEGEVLAMERIADAYLADRYGAGPVGVYAGDEPF